MSTKQGKSHNRCRNEPFSLANYALMTQAKHLSAGSIYRAIVCNLPRTLHQLDASVQRQILKKAPPLQHTPWDALLAATAEHFAERHGHAPEPWMNERERFLDSPWMPNTQGHYSRWEAAPYCPGAFTRHGTPIHPSDLDSRGGDDPWKPDCCEAAAFREDSEIFTA